MPKSADDTAKPPPTATPANGARNGASAGKAAGTKPKASGAAKPKPSNAPRTKSAGVAKAPAAEPKPTASRPKAAAAASEKPAPRSGSCAWSRRRVRCVRSGGRACPGCNHRRYWPEHRRHARAAARRVVRSHRRAWHDCHHCRRRAQATPDARLTAGRAQPRQCRWSPPCRDRRPGVTSQSGSAQVRRAAAPPSLPDASAVDAGVAGSMTKRPSRVPSQTLDNRVARDPASTPARPSRMWPSTSTCACPRSSRS